MVKKILFCFVLLSVFNVLAHPYWNESIVPKDIHYPYNKDLKSYFDWSRKVSPYRPPGLIATSVVRITVAWDELSESYKVFNAVIENSGTPALLLRAKTPPIYGSYRGSINDVYYDSVGTGKEYRKLARQISFRFPLPTKDFTFKMDAENPVTGNLEKVLETKIALTSLKNASAQLTGVDIRQLKQAISSPSLEVVIYAEGYKLINKDKFFQSALKAVDVLKDANIPGFNNMNFVGVFAVSNLELGSSKNLGLPVKKRDSAFGLFYPYWDDFGRWYHVVYPTDENYFRQSLSIVPYDYNILLVDSSNYWGVGNFKTHTAIPARNGSFDYLLLHEFGHFFGLNEEYDGGGRTELEFAPQIPEAWSQNMTFLPSPALDKLKWSDKVVDRKTPVPTPDSWWKFGTYGAYKGGYGDSNKPRESYKPGRYCVMDTDYYFCGVCKAGMQKVIDYDLGR